jgi:hypothetical protein
MTCYFTGPADNQVGVVCRGRGRLKICLLKEKMWAAFREEQMYALRFKGWKLFNLLRTLSRQYPTHHFTVCLQLNSTRASDKDLDKTRPLQSVGRRYVVVPPIETVLRATRSNPNGTRRIACGVSAW